MRLLKEIRNTDYFVGINIILFLLMAFTVYYDRLVAYRGPGNIHEFFIYACAILLVIVLVWLVLRRLWFPGWLLLLIEIGILMHFAGAFVEIEGGRLYDAHVLGIRYDKYVHGFNGLAGAALINHLLGATRMLTVMQTRVPVRPLIVIGLVLGAGAIVEILEYLVVLTVPNNGVGNYDNNLQDLIANLAGAMICMTTRGAILSARGPADPPGAQAPAE